MTKTAEAAKPAEKKTKAKAAPKAAAKPKKITKPGVYDLKMATYHSQCCDGPSVSSSGVKDILDCPARFFNKQAWLNPHAEETASTAAMDMGSLAHAVVVGEDFFHRHFALSPHDEFRSNEAKAWRADQEASGKTVVTKKQFENAQAMARVIRDHEFATRLFQGGKHEQSMVWKDAETGLWLKSRPDWLPDNRQHFPTDYKTTETVEPQQFGKTATNLNYHVQMAMVRMGVEALTGFKPMSVAIVAQERKAPYLVQVYAMPIYLLDYGELLVRRALRVMADCLERNDWPGYSGEIEELTVPRWKQVEAEAGLQNPERIIGKESQNDHTTNTLAAG